MLRTTVLMALVTAAFALMIEGVSWLVVGSAPLDPRYACAASAHESDFTVFSYGGSTVYGTPVPEYGFMTQIATALERKDASRYTVCNMGEGGRDSSGVLLDIERTLQYQPDVVIVMSGHNEFLQPSFEATAMRRWRERIRDFASVRLFNKVMEKIARRMGPPAVQQAMPEEQHAHDRNGADFKARVARYQANITAMVDTAHDANIPVVFATMASNLDEWSPVYQRLPVGEGGVRAPEHVAKIIDLLLAGERDQAEAAFNALSWDSAEASAPVVAYLRAQFMPMNTEAEAASRRAALIAARDADPIPWRVLSPFNEHVRSVMTGRPDVVLVDVERLLGDAAGDGLPGFSLITDNCHPTPVANQLIATALLDGVKQITGEPVAWSHAEFEAWLPTLPDVHRLDFLLRNGVYVMKVPFFNYAASKRYLEEARERWPDDWRSWGNLASIELMTGDIERGRALLSEALARQPDVALYKGHQHTPYLVEALKRHGLTLEAFVAEQHTSS